MNLSMVNKVKFNHVEIYMTYFECSKPNTTTHHSSPAWPLYNKDTQLFLCLNTPDNNDHKSLNGSTTRKNLAERSAGATKALPPSALTCVALIATYRR